MPRRNGRNTNVEPGLSAEAVRHLVGNVGNDTVRAILRRGVSAEELEIAAGCMLGEDPFDLLATLLTGKIADLCEILEADEFYKDESMASPTLH